MMHALRLLYIILWAGGQVVVSDSSSVSTGICRSTTVQPPLCPAPPSSSYLMSEDEESDYTSESRSS
jgi:hypothetical protein